jgi:hypothetical protein
MRVRTLIFGLLLLGLTVASGCGWRQNAYYRRPCYAAPQPALLPVTPVPVTAASPCCACP